MTVVTTMAATRKRTRTAYLRQCRCIESTKSPIATPSARRGDHTYHSAQATPIVADKPALSLTLAPKTAIIPEEVGEKKPPRTRNSVRASLFRSPIGINLFPECQNVNNGFFNFGLIWLRRRQYLGVQQIM